MIKAKSEEMGLIADLFKEVDDSMVIACLQGYMGDAWVDKLPNPTVGLIVSGEYSFFAGDAESVAGKRLAEELFTLNPNDSTIAIFGYGKSEWENTLLSVTKNNPKVVPRFRIGQTAQGKDFDTALLQNIVDGLPDGFTLKEFDADIYQQAMAADWSKEFCEMFSSVEDYLEKGFGFAAVHDGRLVSGASSMTIYDGGIEIQVATHEGYRQMGLALPCAAALVLECVKRGLRPHWDAANLTSKHMALKLGYEYLGEYITIHMHR